MNVCVYIFNLAYFSSVKDYKGKWVYELCVFLLLFFLPERIEICITPMPIVFKQHISLAG